MSAWEGSKWQERQEDAKKYNPVNLPKEDLIQAVKTANKSVKEYEAYCKRLELAVTKLFHDMKAIDECDNNASIMDIYRMATKSIAEAEVRFSDLQHLFQPEIASNEQK